MISARSASVIADQRATSGSVRWQPVQRPLSPSIRQTLIHGLARGGGLGSASMRPDMPPVDALRKPAPGAPTSLHLTIIVSMARASGEITLL